MGGLTLRLPDRGAFGGQDGGLGWGRPGYSDGARDLQDLVL